MSMAMLTVGEDPGIMAGDEAHLIRRSQAGDVQAFNVVVERYQHRLYAMCYWMLGDAEAAADITQDTFLSAFRNIQHHGRGPLGAWLHRIARNACYDYLRARKRRPHISLDSIVHAADEPPHQLTDSGEAPDDRVLRNELACELRRRLQDLPEDQRLVVVLSDIQGYSYEEVAGATGWPLGTVKSRLSRARGQLRAALRAGGHFRHEDAR